MTTLYLLSVALFIVLLVLLLIFTWAWRLHREVRHLHKVLRELAREGEEEDLQTRDRGKNGSF